METTRRTHELKTAPQYFREIANGNKPFEVRRNDRDYHVGDILKLREYGGSDYSGQEISVEVTYILDNPEYCKDGYVIMGIKPIGGAKFRKSAGEKFDPQKLVPFVKVLARHDNDCIWTIDLFGGWRGKDAMGASYRRWTQVVPYNGNTAYLLWTNLDAPEYYRWWEDER